MEKVNCAWEVALAGVKKNPLRLVPARVWTLTLSGIVYDFSVRRSPSRRVREPSWPEIAGPATEPNGLLLASIKDRFPLARWKYISVKRGTFPSVAESVETSRLISASLVAVAVVTWARPLAVASREALRRDRAASRDCTATATLG